MEIFNLTKKITYSLNMSKLEKQHFIPEFFLKNFVEAESRARKIYRLWSHRKGVEPVLCSTRKLARKKHIYSTRKKIGDTYEKSHEQLLDKIESIAAPIITKILTTKDLFKLDQRERDDFSIFIVILAERNPIAFSTTDAMMRRLFLKEYAESMKKTSDSDLREIYEKSKAKNKELENVSFEEARQVMLEGPKEENLALPFSHGISSMWQAAKECSKYMHMRQWQLLSSEKVGKHFWLSDNPVIKIRDIPEEEVYEVMQGGWGRKDLEIALPLSPTLCFYAAGKVDEQFSVINTTSVAAINWWTVQQAVDEVYTATKELDVWS